MSREQRFGERPARIARAVMILALATFAALCCPVGVRGQQVASTRWPTGDALRRQMEVRVKIDSSVEPLRAKFTRLAHNLQVPFFLDRRIDPSQELEFSFPEMPLRNCIEAIAARLDTGVCFVGPLVYFGPKTTTSRLATLSALREDEISRLPAQVRQRLSRVVAWEWPDLATPRDLLGALGDEAGVTLLGLDQIPHDLWAAADLPPLAYSERLTLILAGFDRTFEVDESGRQVRLVDMPAKPLLTRSYNIDSAQTVPPLQQVAPQTQIKREGPRLTVTGSAEEHDLISRLLRGEKLRKSTAGAAKTDYTMRGPAALGTVLKTLQVKAGINVIVDPAIQKKLYERVTFEVKDASLEELIAAVLKDTGLRFELTGRDLRILPSTEGDAPPK